MMTHHSAAAMALPILPPSIPLEWYIPGGNTLTVPLAIALLEAGVATDEMLRPGANATLIEVFGEPDERELSMLALSQWWDGLRRSHPLDQFRWQLYVQELHNLPSAHKNESEPEGWFCLDRIGNRLIPRVSLARRVEHLEAVLEGFGQTVLAVLYEAFRYLPEALTPWRAVECMYHVHWHYSETDDELREIVEEYGGDMEGVFTRAEFYAGIPQWVTAPRQVRSRRQIVRAARGEYEKNVIAACDAIFKLVSRAEFDLDPYSVGTHKTGLDPVDACIVVLWRDNDTIGRALDDGLNYFMEAGETCEMIDAQPVPLNATAILRYQRRTEQMLQVAELTEALLELIGEPI